MTTKFTPPTPEQIDHLIRNGLSPDGMIVLCDNEDYFWVRNLKTAKEFFVYRGQKQ